MKDMDFLNFGKGLKKKNQLKLIVFWLVIVIKTDYILISYS
jgi:hypothetical protein